jgi:Chemotaxis phosphatase CheX
MNQSILDEKVRSILEDGALLFADPVDLSEEDVFADSDADIGDLSASEETLRLQLPFDGDASGRLCLFCHPAIGESVARNLLGIAEDEPCAPELAVSSAGELLNIIAGSLLAQLVPRRTGIRMSTPVPMSTGPAEILRGQNLRSRWSIEGRPLAVSVEWLVADAS